MKAAGSKLVDLVEHHHAVARCDLAQILDDVPRQRTDVGSPVSAYFRLIVHASQACAHELAAGCLGDTLPKRGLAYAGRADEAQDRALARRIELAHREILEDAPLDLVEPVVVFIEDASRLGDVDGRLALGRPGQIDQPVEIGADHRIFARAFLHPLQALQLLARLLLDFLGHLRLGDRLVELRDLGAALLAFAQLLLNRAHLLAQQMLAIHVADRFLGAFVNLLGYLEYFDAVRKQLQQLVQPRLEIESLQ